MTMKQRTFLAHQSGGVYTDNVGNVTRYAFRFVNWQRTYTQGNPYWVSRAYHRYRKVLKTMDLGGPFQTGLSSCQPGEKFVNVVRPFGAGVRTYVGPLFAYNSNFTGKLQNIHDISSWTTLESLGSTAIARTLPTNPLAGLGQFLGELRQLPKLPDIQNWKTRAENFRNIKRVNWGSNLRKGSDEYLNYVFGWLPLIKDVKDGVKAVRNADKTMAQYQRDSGRNVRRSYRFPDEKKVVVTEMGLGYGAPSLDTYLYISPGKLSKTVTTTRKVWFKGCYTYYLPKEGTFGNVEAHAAKLFGLRITPHLLWQLGPWSWAADWITNFGDVVKNMSAFQNDGLVLRYGYVMEESTVTTEYALNGLELHGTGKLNLVQSFTTKVKRRIKATPYGFGFDPGTFSARQWSIIAALGINRIPRSLGERRIPLP